MIRLWLLKTIILGLTKYSQKSNILIFCIFFCNLCEDKKEPFQLPSSQKVTPKLTFKT